MNDVEMTYTNNATSTGLAASRNWKNPDGLFYHPDTVSRWAQGKLGIDHVRTGSEVSALCADLLDSFYMEVVAPGRLKQKTAVKQFCDRYLDIINEVKREAEFNKCRDVRDEYHAPDLDSTMGGDYNRAVDNSSALASQAQVATSKSTGMVLSQAQQMIQLAHQTSQEAGRMMAQELSPARLAEELLKGAAQEMQNWDYGDGNFFGQFEQGFTEARRFIVSAPSQRLLGSASTNPEQ